MNHGYTVRFITRTTELHLPVNDRFQYLQVIQAELLYFGVESVHLLSIQEMPQSP
jgi:hypothetical protein